MANRNNSRGFCKKCVHCEAIKSWNKRNRDKTRVWGARYLKRNVEARLRARLRDRIDKIQIPSVRGAVAIQHLGCSVSELKSHLESLFQDGMSWENWGYGSNKWNLDHIKPLGSFDLSKESHLKKVCHYSNLRPLWQTEHLALPRPSRKAGVSNGLS